MENPLKNINLKWWHTMLLTTSFFLFVLSLTVQFSTGGLDNAAMQLLSSSVFFISLGGFANKTFQTSVGQGFSITRDISRITFFGTIFYIVGIYLLYKGIVYIL